VLRGSTMEAQRATVILSLMQWLTLNQRLELKLTKHSGQSSDLSLQR
jgi:hypothetical protein